MDGNAFVTLTAAADRTNVPVRTLRHWIECGRLPAAPGGHGRLVRVEDVLRIIGPVDQAHGIVDATLRRDAAPIAQSYTPRSRADAGDNAAAFMDRLDGENRAQATAEESDIRANDDLIAGLRRRLDLAEEKIADLEQRLAVARPSDGSEDTTGSSRRRRRLFTRLIPWLKS